jgi:hypothetical protein
MNRMSLVRYWLPAALIVAGFVCLFAISGSGRIEAWSGFVGAGVAVLALNLMFRMSAGEERERSREDEARDHYAKHGRWPEDHPR